MAFGEQQVEILELAIAREVEAYNLYVNLASRVKDPQMRNIFEQVANEELDHKARLELELIKLGFSVPSASQTQDIGLDDDDKQDVFPKEQDLDIDYKEMLIFAMRKEQKSLRLYIEMATLVKDKESREMLVTLAENEAMHQARFEVEYNILMRRQTE
jgi:rubrerythrin